MTSGASYVRALLLRRAQRFFRHDLMALKEPPYRRAAAGNLVLAHRTNHLIQRQVRLFIDQSKQKLSMLLQRRDAPAPRLGGTAAALAK